MKNPFGYNQTLGRIEEPLQKPSYDQFLKWASVAESKSIAYDIWARGNYMRHVSLIEAKPNDTVIIPFKYIDELRCYYRRTALMGLSTHFIYTGELSSPQKSLCLHPSDNYEIDAGRGWVGSLGSKVRTRGRDWFPVTGYSRPLPEIFVEWLTTEAADSFRQGELIISPAELVGIDRNFMDCGIEQLAQDTNSSSIFSQVSNNDILFNLEIPYIDKMDHSTFLKILEDNSDRLLRFRHALNKLVTKEHSNQLDEVVEELKDEIAQLRLSDSGLKLRETVSKFGGIFTTFGAGIAAVGVASGRGTISSDYIAPTLAGIVGAGAINSVLDVVKQKIERNTKRRENKYSIFWDLGIKSPSDMKRVKSPLKFKKHNQILPNISEESFDCHWLCEPGPLGFLMVRRVTG
jgi:hypothetical protein